MNFDPGFIARNSEFITRFIVGDLEYVLLIISMLMTRMLMLRAVAVSSGVAGAAYSFVWLSDPVGTFWEVTFTLVNIGQITLTNRRSIRRSCRASSPTKCAGFCGLACGWMLSPALS